MLISENKEATSSHLSRCSLTFSKISSLSILENESDHIHLFPQLHQTLRPVFVFHSSTPIFSCPCVYRCMNFHYSMVSLPGGYTLKENWLSPSKSQLPIAPCLKVGLHVHLPFDRWDLVWLELAWGLYRLSQLPCVHMYSSHVGWRTLFSCLHSPPQALTVFSPSLPHWPVSYGRRSSV